MSKKKQKQRTVERESPSMPPPAPDWKIWAAAASIAAAGGIVYLNSFKGVFVFDDAGFIAENPSIFSLWPPWRSMFSSLLCTRPVMGLSLAVSYALSGLDTWGYHALNLAVHLLAGLTLFGLIRRTLLSRRLRERFGGNATGLAWAIALLWTVHPLQTQAVTYIIQRGESMMGLFFLLTIYCVARGFDSRHSRGWHGAAFAACAAGMGCKQVMIVAPLLALLYDAVFLSASLSGAWRRRWGLWTALAATGLIIPLGFLGSLQNTSAGFGVTTVTPWQYALTQFGVILHYLRLALWPAGLCLDYNWHAAHGWREILPGLLLVGGLLVATLWALFRAPAWGFLGAWFFIILAPTSSIMPIADLAVEHRMYLPLAAVLAGVVLSIADCGLQIADYQRARSNLIQNPKSKIQNYLVVAVILSAIALGYLTIQRNTDYYSPLALWGDVARKRPDNSRAFANLGQALNEQKKYGEAEIQLRHAIELKPDFADAHGNLGCALAEEGKLAEAVVEFTEAARIKPDYYQAHFNLALALEKLNQKDEALAAYLKLVKVKPDYAMGRYKLAGLYAKMRDMDNAIAQYREAVKANPSFTDAYCDLGAKLIEQGKFDEAEVPLAVALKLAPDDPYLLNNMATVLLKQGKTQAAIDAYERALKLMPDFPMARQNLSAAKRSLK